MNHEHQIKLQSALDQLFTAVMELGKLFPGRHFTPDGHLVGSLGEALAERDFELELVAPSNNGYDAIIGERKIEIKATFGDSEVAFRDKHPSHALVLKLSVSGDLEVVFNGPFWPVRQIIDQSANEKGWPPNGQIGIRLTKLRELNKAIDDAERVKMRSAN